MVQMSIYFFLAAFLSIMNLNYSKFHLKFTEYIITVPLKVRQHVLLSPDQSRLNLFVEIFAYDMPLFPNPEQAPIYSGPSTIVQL